MLCIPEKDFMYVPSFIFIHSSVFGSRGSVLQSFPAFTAKLHIVLVTSDAGNEISISYLPTYVTYVELRQDMTGPSDIPTTPDRCESLLLLPAQQRGRVRGSIHGYISICDIFRRTQ